MEVVIDIPDYLYEHIKNMSMIFQGRGCGKTAITDIIYAIKLGTPLPPKHGRLGDLDALESEMCNGIQAGFYIEGYEGYPHINNMDDCVECVRFADTIISECREVNDEGSN